MLAEGLAVALELRLAVPNQIVEGGGAHHHLVEVGMLGDAVRHWDRSPKAQANNTINDLLSASQETTRNRIGELELGQKQRVFGLR